MASRRRASKPAVRAGARVVQCGIGFALLLASLWAGVLLYRFYMIVFPDEGASPPVEVGPISGGGNARVDKEPEVLSPLQKALRQPSGSTAQSGSRGQTMGQGEKSKEEGDVHEPPAAPADRSSWPLYLEGYDLRGLRCDPEWQGRDTGDVVCVMPGGGDCPPLVRPDWLTSAEHGNQYLCTEPMSSEYYCEVKCNGKRGDVEWMAKLCESEGQKPCKSPEERAAASTERTGGVGMRAGGMQEHDLGLPVGEGPPVNLRGLSCELKEGKEVCFREGSSGEREICPDFVTSGYLSSGADQWLCTPEAPKTHYCVVSCQEGNENVMWGAHEIAWCDKNPGQCPDRPKEIPRSEFRLKPWSYEPPASRQCHTAKLSDELIPDVTFAILAHGTRETRTIRDTLRTYEENGLLTVANDVIVFINARNSQLDAVMQPYVKKYGKKFRVMGDTLNYGLTLALDWMVGNATNPYLLFLEKDFQLLEPGECVREQMETGVKLLRDGTAHAVRYRSRSRPGRPNWAEIMFKGKEEEVFGRQPNLFCNHYYWVPEPEKRWPELIWRCHEKPLMLCSKAKYCNWTNNPTLFETKWWQKEYQYGRFKKWTRLNPYEHLEMYMNWEPGSWNDEPWVVAEGDGLFKHVDRNNFA